MSFEIIKRYYKTGLWNTAMVRLAVRKGAITPEQFREITGEDY